MHSVRASCFASLFVCVILLLLGSAQGYAQSAALPFHMETAPARHIRALLSDTWETPGIAAQKWAFFIPVPPSCVWQNPLRTSLTVDNLPAAQGITQELSPLHRPLLWVRVPAPRRRVPEAVTARVLYDIVLCSRRLVPGPPAAPVVPLSAFEQKCSTRVSETIDFRDVAFAEWLDFQGLHPAPSERDLDFAFRVYQKIRKVYHYRYEAAQSRKVSSLCHTNATDCGGLSNLFVAALRAGGVPAHTLGGRLAKSAVRPDDRGQCHVRAEFFAAGIGWVPVDMSFGVGASDRDALKFFGNDPGDFLAMFCDWDFVLSPGRFGMRPQAGFQSLSHWVWGDGILQHSTDSEDWQVEELPLATGL